MEDDTVCIWHRDFLSVTENISTDMSARLQNMVTKYPVYGGRKPRYVPSPGDIVMEGCPHSSSNFRKDLRNVYDEETNEEYNKLKNNSQYSTFPPFKNWKVVSVRHHPKKVMKLNIYLELILVHQGMVQ